MECPNKRAKLTNPKHTTKTTINTEPVWVRRTDPE